MSFEHENLLAKLRDLDIRARDVPGSADLADRKPDDEVIELLGLSSSELTPAVRATICQLIEELVGLREQLGTTLARLAEVERLANEDSLAPINNRRAFLRHVARTIAYVERYRTASSLLYFDLNDLKSINDTHGHGAGDAALIHVARILRDHTRSSDAVGRLGGDEFGVILTHADTGAAWQKAETLAHAIAATEFAWNGTVIPVSVAHGAYCLAPGDDPKDALSAADAAMYQQKRRTASGRGRDPLETGATQLRR